MAQLSVSNIIIIEDIFMRQLRRVKRAVCLIHGFPQSEIMWLSVKGQLPPGSAFTLPLPGYQPEQPPIKDFSMSNLVTTIVRKIREHTPESITLVGHDWGGLISWYIANQHPELVKHLVTVCAPHPTMLAEQLDHNPVQQEASAYIKSLLKKDAATIISENDCKLFDQMFLQRHLRKGWLSTDQAAAYRAQWKRPGLVANMLAYYSASFKVENGSLRFRCDQNISNEITVPTTVILGQKDSAFAVGCFDPNRLKELVPNAEVHPVRGTHWVSEENPTAVASLIKAITTAPQKSHNNNHSI